MIGRTFSAWQGLAQLQKNQHQQDPTYICFRPPSQQTLELGALVPSTWALTFATGDWGEVLGVAATYERQLGRRMQLFAISESREEEEGLLTKTETRKMTTMTKNLLPFREPNAFASCCDQDSSNRGTQERHTFQLLSGSSSGPRARVGLFQLESTRGPSSPLSP